jgi:hypothetical protein
MAAFSVNRLPIELYTVTLLHCYTVLTSPHLTSFLTFLEIIQRGIRSVAGLSYSHHVLAS